MYVDYSTGVGRTGIFIALLAQLDRANKENVIDVHKYVQYMFKQRKSILLNEVWLSHRISLSYCILYIHLL